LSLSLRIFCVIFFCAAYLVMSVELRVRDSSSAATGNGLINAANSSETTDGFTCGIQDFRTDAILSSERENNPFLFLLCLRAAFVPSPFLHQGESALSESRNELIAASSPDMCPPPVYLLAQSAQLLC